MKKLIYILILAMSFSSCNIGDDGANSIGDFYFQYVPIESVDMPDEFIFGEAYIIEYTYFRSSSCQTFNDLYYNVDNNIRTIAVINRVFVDNGQCIDLQDELITRSFNFVVTSSETYLFRFWQGEDTNGEDIYLELEIPVVQ